jgi:hypothetical protein
MLANDTAEEGMPPYRLRIQLNCEPSIASAMLRWQLAGISLLAPSTTDCVAEFFACGCKFIPFRVPVSLYTLNARGVP